MRGNGLSRGVIIGSLALFLLQSCDWEVGDSAYREVSYAPAGKQAIVINIGLEPESLDPQMTNGVSEISVLKTLFEGLVQTDTNGTVIPGVAQSWEQKDYEVWTFHLRKDARWSDGAPVTAHDFVYSWRRLISPKTASPVTSALTDVAVTNAKEIVAGKKAVEELGIKALDDYTLEVTLEKPVPFFLATLDSPALYALPHDAIERYGNHWTQPEYMNNNGPYRLRAWHVNNGIEVVRNPFYWDNKNTRNEKLVFLPIVSKMGDVINYMSGNEDISYMTLPSEIFLKLKKHYPNELHVGPFACVDFYDMNLKKPPFNDRRVRLALSMTMPRRIIVDSVLAQGQEVDYTATPYFINHFQRLQPEWAKWTSQKKDREAKRLLKEAGYSKSNPLKFELLYNTSEQHRSVAITAITQWAKRLGVVRVTLNNMEWKTYLDAMRLGNFTMIRRGNCTSYNEPSVFLLANLSDSPDNYDGYHNPKYDAVIHSVFDKDIDEATLTSRYVEAEKILLEDAPIIPIYSYVQTRLVKKYVKGFRMGLFDNLKLNHLWLDYGTSTTH
ncbi:MAG: ABC transporter substrate-binding protein [Neisseriaceae bacterium]